MRDLTELEGRELLNVLGSPRRERLAVRDVRLPFLIQRPRQIANVDFVNVDLGEVVLKPPRFGTLEIASCSFRDVSFEHSLFYRTVFRSCQFDNCEFMSSRIEDGRLEGCTFEACTFDEVYWERVVVKRVRLINAKARRLAIQNASIEDAALSGVFESPHISRSKLRGVDFSDAVLKDATLSGELFEDVVFPQREDNFVVAQAAFSEVRRELASRVSPEVVATYDAIVDALPSSFEPIDEDSFHLPGLDGNYIPEDEQELIRELLYKRRTARTPD